MSEAPQRAAPTTQPVVGPVVARDRTIAHVRTSPERGARFCADPSHPVRSCRPKSTEAAWEWACAVCGRDWLAAATAQAGAAVEHEREGR